MFSFWSFLLPPFYHSLLLAWQVSGGYFSNPSNSLSIGSHSGVCHPVESLSCKLVHQYILSFKASSPHCVAKFLPIYNSLYWSSTWKQLFLMPSDCRVINLNWKICHGVLYTAARLSSFGYNHSTTFIQKLLSTCFSLAPLLAVVWIGSNLSSLGLLLLLVLWLSNIYYLVFRMMRYVLFHICLFIFFLCASTSFGSSGSNQPPKWVY